MSNRMSASFPAQGGGWVCGQGGARSNPLGPPGWVGGWRLGGPGPDHIYNIYLYITYTINAICTIDITHIEYILHMGFMLYDTYNIYIIYYLMYINYIY